MIDTDGSIRAMQEVCTWTSGLLKIQNDLDRYQRIIDKVHPTVVIETGFAYGDSARFFAERVAKVISVEKNQDYVNAQIDNLPPNVVVIVDEATGALDEVKSHLTDSDIVLVSLDTDHHDFTVFPEMELYGPLVTVGSYCVVEDSIYGYMDAAPNIFCPPPSQSPRQAIERFLREIGGFENDMEIEDMTPITQSPGGWLRRVR